MRPGNNKTQSGGGLRQADELNNRVAYALRLHQSGQIGNAEAAYRQVLAAKPGHPAAAHFLGLLLHQTGRDEEGLPLVSLSIRAEPRNADFLNNLGTIQRDIGNPVAAAESFRKALAARPEHPMARENLAAADLQVGRLESAEKLFREALIRSPFNVSARLGLAETLQEAGRADASLAVLREGLSMRPNDAELMRRLGTALLEKGDLAEAAATARQAIATDQNLAGAWFLLSQVKRQAEPDAELAELKARQERSPEGSPERMLLSFALGKLYDDLKEYDNAFDFFSKGNAIRRKAIAYDVQKTREQFAAMKAAFSAEFVAERRARQKKTLADDTPIFVVGMPRSGTTLVEQIIASHPDVRGGGELGILKGVVERRFPPLDGDDLAAALGRVPDKTFVEAGRDYVEALRSRFPGTGRVTDKMPGNFMLIGFIALTMPNAKIIHCVRDPADTGVSIWRNFFATHLGYAYDLGEIGHYITLYQRLMAHWHRVLPGRIYDIEYEALVADQEGETRRLLFHCGLDFDPACLDFHRTERPVHTASAAQVRSPISRSSIGIADRYGELLAPLRAALAGHAIATPPPTQSTAHTANSDQ